MGVALSEIITGHETSIKELAGKAYAVDAFNMLYQFITTIRMQDGTPLKDREGEITSHLAGLLSRCSALVGDGLKLLFVFDGEAPELKREERARRRALKEEAARQHHDAEEREDVEAMRKYAGRTARLTPTMIDEAKELLEAMGIPHITAPSEGEAQAAHLCKQGIVHAVISQDADAFLFGAPRVVRNLNITGRRRQAKTFTYQKTSPMRYTFEENLHRLGLTQEQLVVLGILVGTDYNRAGIPGIGPKRALKLVTEYGDRFDDLFAHVKWEEVHPTLHWKHIRKTIMEMPVRDEKPPRWAQPDEARLKRLLLNRNFSEERVQSAADRLRSTTAQKGLGEFL